jgi:hypothetical protein
MKRKFYFYQQRNLREPYWTISFPFVFNGPRCLKAKYGKDRYEVVFAKEKIKLKYAFVTFDWARDKDFLKHSRNGGSGGRC